MSAPLGAQAAAPLTPDELAMLAQHRNDDGGDCIMPVPAEASPLPVYTKNGRAPDHRFEYRASDGGLLGYVLRWEECDDRRKEFSPATYWRRNGGGKASWQLKNWPGKRPLFGLDQLAARPDAIVLVVEGEKKVRAVEFGPLADAFTWAKHPFVGICWPGGSNAVKHADFSPLAGRDVIVLPDNDQPGEAAADELVKVLQEVGVRRLRRWRAPTQARDKWDIADELPDGITPEALIGSMLEAPEIKAQGVVAWWRDPATIPPRQSLYDGHYIRRQIGATIGGGGRAKTTRGGYEGICMSVGFDIATKDPLPEGKLRVWICNGEEDQDELDRRAAATCQHYGITQEDLGGRLFVQSVRDKPLRIATLVNNRPVIDQAVLKFMTDFIKDNSIDVFMLDPLVSFHGVMENDNGHMDLVIKEGFGAIANSTNSAGEMFHHPGKAKPGQPDTSVEDGRGASAILWAVRSARVFNFMTPEEATKLGLSEDERRLHIRIANGKANMGPLGKAKWMKLLVEDLVNGDHVAVASPWSPPDPFKGITTADMELARKLATTGEYRADSRSPKWFGYAIADHLQMPVSHHGDNDPKDMARLNSIIKTWFKNKVLDVEERKDADGKDRKFVVAGSFKPSSPANAYPDDEVSLQ
jgi:AAA domain